MKYLSLIVFEIFAKIAFWPLNLGPRSKVMAPNESPYMVSYMSIIKMKSLSLAVFEIFAKITLWPLVMAPNESPYMVSYVSTIEMKSLSLVVLEIFAKNSILNSWPWTKVKGHSTKWKPIHGFLHNCDKNGVSYSHCSWDIWKRIRSKWVFGVQGATMHSTMCF